MHIELETYKLKLLRKLVIQYDIRACFDRMLWVQTISPLFTYMFVADSM